MRATIDKAGRLVIPRALRDRVGLGPGEVEVTADGAGLRVEALSGDGITTRAGRPVIPASGTVMDDDVVRELRDAGQRWADTTLVDTSVAVAFVARAARTGRSVPTWRCSARGARTPPSSTHPLGRVACKSWG